MKNKTKYLISISLLLFILALFCASIVLTSYFNNLWWTIVLSSVAFVTLFILTMIIYLKHTEFICPKCKQQFKPTKTQVSFAIHTATRRLLKCPHCNKNEWCKEVFIEKEKTAD